MFAPESHRYIAFVADDVDTRSQIDAIESMFPLPVHASVIVTDAHGSIGDLVRKKKRQFMRHEPGVHFDLFEGRFPNNPNKLFGEKGKLHRYLHEIESLRKRSVAVSGWLDYLTSSQFAKFSEEILAEFDRQLLIGKMLFNGKVPYLTYHFGMHHSRLLNRLFEETAVKHNIRFRRADQYAPPSVNGRRHLAFHDGLNRADLTPEIMARELEFTAQRGLPTEFCIHPGQDAVGVAQVAALTSGLVRRKLREFSVQMPHDILRKRREKVKVSMSR